MKRSGPLQVGSGVRGRVGVVPPLALLLAASAAFAHPHAGGQSVAHVHTPLGLAVTIADDGVTCEVMLSNGFLNMLIPRERGHLKLARIGEVFAFLDPQQEAAERDIIAAFFADEAPAVTIDGAEIAATIEKFEYIPSMDPTGLLDHSLSPLDARVLLRFPAATPPRRVQITWSLFAERQSRDLFGRLRPTELPAKLDAYAESRIVTLTPASADLIWEAPPPDIRQRIAPVQVALTARSVMLPTVSLALAAGWLLAVLGLRICGARLSLRRLALVAGVPLLAAAFLVRDRGQVAFALPGPPAPAPITETAAQDAFTALLRNVYRAFDFKSESDVYDVLAQSVDGEELVKIYNEIYESLVAREQGGAVSRVKDVDFVTVQLDRGDDAPANDADAFQVRCRWRVHGVVHHWGHVHERINEYKALYTIARRGDLWKITGCEVLGQRRLANDPLAEPAEGSDPS